MRLADLIVEPAVLVGDGECEIEGLSLDTRSLSAGDLFAALEGRANDGRAFVGEAIARGARAILTDRLPDDPPAGVAFVVAPDPRRTLSLMAARFFAVQPRCVVAVTGTNGKTSVANFVRQLFEYRDLHAASLGTLGITMKSREERGSLTTPDPITLHRTMARLASEGVTHLAMEASSHALDQRRLDGIRLAAAAFTNLSRDHLDYHGDMEGYFTAKSRLFTEILPEGAPVVLNADSALFGRLVEIAKERGNDIIDFGTEGSRIRLRGHKATRDGQEIRIELDGRPYRLACRLVGSFQTENVLCALGLAMAVGLDGASLLGALEGLKGTRGRMERVTRLANGAVIYVDYAHTPDALEAALRALRPHVERRLIVVFGAGGDRDPGKRALMGKAASEGADLVIVTDDNPRSEDPALIRRAILAGCAGGLEIGDRAAAILHGMSRLEAGDALLVAGKGHETGQTVQGRVLPFDDASVIRRFVAEFDGEPRS